MRWSGDLIDCEGGDFGRFEGRDFGVEVGGALAEQQIVLVEDVDVRCKDKMR